MPGSSERGPDRWTPIASYWRRFRLTVAGWRFDATTLGILIGAAALWVAVVQLEEQGDLNAADRQRQRISECSAAIVALQDVTVANTNSLSDYLDAHTAELQDDEERALESFDDWIPLARELGIVDILRRRAELQCDGISGVRSQGPVLALDSLLAPGQAVDGLNFDRVTLGQTRIITYYLSFEKWATSQLEALERLEL